MRKARIQVKNKGDKTLQVELQQDLNIQTIHTVEEKLKALLPDYKSFTINVSETSSVDITLLQLLYAFRNSAEKDGKEVKFSFDLDNETKNLLGNAGFGTLFDIA